MSIFHRSRTKLHGILGDTHRDGNERCRECGGVCCRSFTDVALTWDEYQRLQRLGATRLYLGLIGPPRLIIDYNCEFLDGGRCLIYGDRPDICRRFSCEKLE